MSASTSRPPRTAPESGVYSSPAEAIMAMDRGALSVRARIKVRLTQLRPPAELEAELFGGEGWKPGDAWTVETTLGRVLFNELLPHGYAFINEQMHKKVQARIINDLAERFPMIVVAQTVDKLKDAGFYWATRSGVTVSMADVLVPPEKREILERYEKEADGIEKKYQRGALNHQERNEALVKIWQDATEEVGEALRSHYPEDNPIITIVESGATGNFTQTRTLAGMKGLVTNPKGEFIPRPIKSSFREGLTVLEYFINTHGARKGLADTALRTADSGYLTRRLVDVSQDVIVREHDCGTERGITVRLAEVQPDGSLAKDQYVETSAYARTLAEDATDEKGKVLVEKGHDLGDPAIDSAAGERHLVGAGAVGADMRERQRRLCDVLRPVDGDGQARRHRRGGWHRRRAVDRRARHAADHAHVPPGRCHRRPGHHGWSAPRAGAVRGPRAARQGAHRRGVRADPDRRG